MSKLRNRQTSFFSKQSPTLSWYINFNLTHIQLDQKYQSPENPLNPSLFPRNPNTPQRLFQTNFHFSNNWKTHNPNFLQSLIISASHFTSLPSSFQAVTHLFFSVFSFFFFWFFSTYTCFSLSLRLIQPFKTPVPNISLFWSHTPTSKSNPSNSFSFSLLSSSLFHHGQLLLSRQHHRCPRHQ